MFDGRYLDWNQKRIKGIIDFYGHQFMAGKKLLDLGCGHADISAALYRLGADVTAVDARQDHLTMVSKKFAGVKTVKADLDKDWPFFNKKYDIILDLGLICHLNDYESHLRNVCASTSYLILETTVCDSDDPYKCMKLSENKNVYDLSINGVSSRPTAAAIERVFKECGFNFKRNDNAKFNAGHYTYDWQSQNNDQCDSNKRRIWFASRDTQAVVSYSLPSNIPIFVPTPINNSPAPILQNSKNIIKPPLNSKIFNDRQVTGQIKQRAANSNKSAPSPIPANGTLKYSDLSNLKVAVCIAGHVRLFEKTYQSFLDNVMFQLPHFDVFMHTWETMGASGGIASDDSIANIKTNNKINQINAIIKPKVLEIETYDVYKTLLIPMENKAILSPQEKAGFRSGHLLPYLSMLYSWKKSKSLLEKYEQDNNIKYDVIIKLRLDEVFTGKINVKFYYLNRIYVPNVGQYYSNAINDQFAIGDNFSMKVYLGLFDWLINYINNKEIYPFRPEILLKYHLKKHSIPIVEVPISYYLLRSNNTVLHLSTHK